MKHASLGLAALLGSALFAAATPADGSIYGSGQGYYYIAYSANSGYPPGYQYHKVGPFAAEEDCWQARNDDYIDGDSWFPFEGTGIKCDWLFHNEVSALDDGLSHWNSFAGGSNPPSGGLGVGQIEAIAELQRGHAIDRYKAALAEIVRSSR